LAGAGAAAVTGTLLVAAGAAAWACDAPDFLSPPHATAPSARIVVSAVNRIAISSRTMAVGL